MTNENLNQSSYKEDFENTGCYRCVARKVDHHGLPQSIWVPMMDAVAFDTAFDYAKDYIEKHGDDEEVKAMEFRILNPYGNDVAFRKAGETEWSFKKDDFEDRHLSENVETILEKLSVNEQKLRILYITSIFHSVGFAAVGYLLFTQIN